MSPPRAQCPRPARFLDEEAITPVIGSILILGISVLGIAAIMAWGAPALQILEEQNAQYAMLGEFEEVRQNSLALTITDGSRLPRVNLGSGEFMVEPDRNRSMGQFTLRTKKGIGGPSGRYANRNRQRRNLR